MKKLFTILFIGTSTLYAQELTADTPAVAATWLDWVLSLGAMLIASSWAWLMLELKKLISESLKPAIAGWLKSLMHFRGAEVIADGVAEEVAALAEEVRAALLDGKLTKKEFDAIKERAAKRGMDRLKNMSGFFKADLKAWVDEQINIAFSKLLARISV